MTAKQTIDSVPRECRECGSTSLSWFAQNTVPNGIQQNRLNTHDVQCVFVLGCDDCSETLKIISADKIADHFNKPAEQPAPVTVALPERMTLEKPESHKAPVEVHNGVVTGWNACLDELKRLNGIER